MAPPPAQPHQAQRVVEETDVFKVLILICAVNVDHAACTPDTAIDIVRGPPAHTMSQCIHESQTTLAQTS